MLTSNQRDILAGVMTSRYIYEDAKYSDWIEEYELHRRRIEETEVDNADRNQNTD